MCTFIQKLQVLFYNSCIHVYELNNYYSIMLYFPILFSGMGLKNSKLDGGFQRTHNQRLIELGKYYVLVTCRVANITYFWKYLKLNYITSVYIPYIYRQATLALHIVYMLIIPSTSKSVGVGGVGVGVYVGRGIIMCE